MRGNYFMLCLCEYEKDIHPKYFEKADISCACGTKYDFGSTKEKINVEICSSCHPFYTGTEKVMDIAGRVEKFKTRKAAAGTKKTKKTEKKEKK